MSLETFLHGLHFNPNHSKSTEWEVDWADAPLQYKLYRGLPAVALSSDIPLTLTVAGGHGQPTLQEISHFLWYVYGLTQFAQSSYVSETATDQTTSITQVYRRFAPSGGALYPNELYIYLKIKELPTGVYHYDVAHHRLILIREGEFDTYLNRVLGQRCEISSCFGVAFISTMFWKNFFKYYYFSYRLQGLDAGVLMGQLLEVAKCFGFETGVYFQFLDHAANHLLGLNPREESVYAVIPLSIGEHTTWFSSTKKGDCSESAAELCRELPLIEHQHYIRSRKIRDYPQLIKINEAAFIEEPRLFRTLEPEKRRNAKEPTVSMPHVQRLDYDLAVACRRRYSPGLDFVLADVNLEKTAALFQQAMDSYTYRNDLDGASADSPSRVSLCACLYGVDGVRDGAYHYDSINHTLHLIRLGDQRFPLLDAMSLDNVNIHQAPLCVHVAGDRFHLRKELGYRGYRIQQMEAGMLVQRLLLIASTLGMNGHPLLGYDVNTCDEIYKLVPHGKTSLIQVPIGYYHPRPRLEGGLHS